MVQVKHGSKKIMHASRKVKGDRDYYCVTLRYSSVDIKTFLREYLKELRRVDMPNKFTQREILELFAMRVFSAIPETTAREMAEWAFEVGLRRGFFTTNRWDREQPTIFFIDKAVVNVHAGRPEKREVETYEDE